MDELRRKKIFAERLHQEPGNPFVAALEAWDGDTGQACKYALLWKNDKEVLQIISDLNECVEDDIPSKTDAILLAWNIANSPMYRGNVRVDALRLCAEILAYMPDKAQKTSVKVDANKVMIVKDHGELEDWEKKALEQQKALIDEN